MTVKRLGKEYDLSAMIADADRVLLEQPEALAVTDSGAMKIDAALKHQLRVLLLERMKAGSLPVDPRMRNPAPVAVTPPPPVEPVKPPVEPPPLTPAPEAAAMSTMRLAGFIAGGVAVVGGLTALILALMANGEVSGLRVENGILQDPDDVARVNGSRSKATIAAAMGGVAAVAAVAAVMMFVMGPAEEPKATVTPIAWLGGGGIAFSGRWP